MTVSSFRQRLLATALFTIVALGLAVLPVSAQQVTYYNFNTPATASPQQYSYSCSPTSPSSNPLFCLNYQGSVHDPSFILDPPSGTTYATQMTTAAGSQASSMWFSVPQKVAQGFNVWFQFRITPAPGVYTADGIAFVIQNAQGPSGSDNNGTDPSGNCTETGSGPTVVGGGGGCIGYGGIDNSLALEFDTFQNAWDPTDISNGNNFTYNDNHIALQDCGAGVSNSPDHADCALTLGAGPGAVPTLISNPLSSADGVTPITLADGNLHDVVIVYNGPLDANPNTLSVFIDPQYNPGTHTPVAGSVPVFTGPFNIQQALNLLNSGSASDSAYVGFTSATGGDWETHEIVGWTFTPHTTVTQQQPLNSPGTPTTYNFGTHSYTVQYPSNADTSTVGMGVIATTITPAQFAALLGLGPAQYAGSSCQVYDDTGGNCIIYSAYCYNTADTSQIEACPAGTQTTICTDPNQSSAGCITLSSSYNSSTTPASPGYLQGDPLFSPFTSMTEQGNTATITCTGECAATQGETITVLDANDNPLFSNVTVATADPSTPNTIVISTPGGPTGTTVPGGYLTSTNVQDIFTSWTPQSLDGTTVGRTQSFSDFVVTSTTLIGTQTSLSPPAGPVIDNQSVPLTATVSAPVTGPTGLTLLSAQYIGNTLSAGNTVGGTVNFSDSNGPILSCQGVTLNPVTNNNVITYQATCNYSTATTGPDTVTATYTGDAYHQGSSNSQTFNVGPQTVQVTIGTLPPNLTFEVVGPTALTSGTYSSQQSLTWNIGTNYSLYAPSPQAGTTGTQYVMPSWNGTGTATDTVTASAATTSYTASFTTQYLLSATAGAGGTVSVANGYYNAQSVESIAAIPNAGYAFSGWTGSSDIASASSASTSITMNKPETITATFSAIPMASVTPSRIDLGTLYLGDIVTKIVTVSNTGGAPMTISDPLIAILPGATGNLSEFVTLNLCPKTLAAGKSCYMTVTFIAGPFYNPQSATLTVNTNAPGPITVPLTATVINPKATVSDASLSFGTVKTNTSSAKSVTLSNSGTTALSIGSIALTGDTTDFSITSNPCPSSLAAGKSCALGITFKPTAKTSDAAALVITDNAKNSPQTVTLSGKGN
ncbi:MAG: choice-of-anchor D domain-containing protein [Acidobacteriaceae bacterium]